MVVGEERARYVQGEEEGSAAVDVERCAAELTEVATFRVYRRQCPHKRKGGTDWCGIHVPLKGTGSFIYVVVEKSSGELEVVEAEIAKETAGQLHLMKSHGAWGYRSRIRKSEAHRTPREAVVAHLERLEERLENAWEQLRLAKALVGGCKRLLSSVEA